MMNLGATELAPDGMRLDRSPQYASNRIEEMPTPEAFQSDALKLVDQMKKLRNAPVVEEDYRGPVLFSNDAAADMFYDLIAPNVLGKRPAPGRPARTNRVVCQQFQEPCPADFLSVVDDPTVEKFGGQSLSGSYKWTMKACRWLL